MENRSIGQCRCSTCARWEQRYIKISNTFRNINWRAFSLFFSVIEGNCGPCPQRPLIYEELNCTAKLRPHDCCPTRWVEVYAYDRIEFSIHFHMITVSFVQIWLKLTRQNACSKDNSMSRANTWISPFRMHHVCAQCEMGMFFSIFIYQTFCIRNDYNCNIIYADWLIEKRNGHALMSIVLNILVRPHWKHLVANAVTLHSKCAQLANIVQKMYQICTNANTVASPHWKANVLYHPPMHAINVPAMKISKIMYSFGRMWMLKIAESSGAALRLAILSTSAIIVHQSTMAQTHAVQSIGFVVSFWSA